MVFIERFKYYCSGSRALAWLLTITISTGLLFWIVGIICSLFGVGFRTENFLVLSSNPIEALTHPWTLLTYMAVHYSPLHLIFNALWLYWFGRMLADVESDKSLLLLFIGGGVSGGLLYLAASALATHSFGSFLTGNSAAVLSVMTATAMLMPTRRIGLFLFGEVQLKWIVIIFIAITILGDGGGMASRAAHIGGLLFGFVWAAQRKGLIHLPQLRKKNKDKAPQINIRAAAKAMRGKAADHERLDQLLDKIRISGYDSLTSQEKAELNYISSRIDK